MESRQLKHYRRLPIVILAIILGSVAGLVAIAAATSGMNGIASIGGWNFKFTSWSITNTTLTAAGTTINAKVTVKVHSAGKSGTMNTFTATKVVITVKTTTGCTITITGNLNFSKKTVGTKTFWIGTGSITRATSTIMHKKITSYTNMVLGGCGTNPPVGNMTFTFT